LNSENQKECFFFHWLDRRLLEWQSNEDCIGFDLT